nr:TYRosinase family member (tyr-3) [Biomphalaria glabrata]
MGVAALPLLLVLALSSIHLSRAKIWQIDIPDNLEECYKRVKDVDVETYVGSLHSWQCEHALINSSLTSTATADADAYIKSLRDIAIKSTGRNTRQITSRCVRKEYRMLTTEERTRYHNAVVALKRDTSVRPNKFDAIANIHTGQTNLIAHGGAGFLGWHRIFLLIYETALRQVDPRICLPYWDSSLEGQLARPLESSLWTPDFFGTPRGPVVDGPFAGWRLPTGVQLIRNAGVDGDLLTPQIISNILTRRRYEEVVQTSASPQYDIELQHGTAHMYVGGVMTRLDTAAFDPIFFMHHAFIDYIFEMFRNRLRSIGVNPAQYPRSNSNFRHEPTATTGFGSYTQEYGYSDALASRTTYEPVPTCSARSPTCGVGSSLVCEVSTGRCLPALRSPRSKRQSSDKVPDTCNVERNYAIPNQNDYCCEDQCDIKEWVMIPVKIVNMRPPRFRKYKSFPVKDGVVMEMNDIYSPKLYEDTKRYISDKQSNLKTYSRCEEDNSVGQIFLYSHGMNYAGYYKESTIVDQKLTVSVSMGYIGVKKPADGAISKAIVRAHDSCGRVCHVACRDKEAREYSICSGAIAVNNERPLMYGNKFDEALLNIFEYSPDSPLPKFKVDNLFLTFYCDYRSDYPFANLPSKKK